MEHLSRRAFTFGFVLFTFTLLVSSATDDNAQTVGAGNAGSLSKVDKTLGAERTETQTSTNVSVTTVKKPDAASETVDKKNCTAGSNETDCDDESFVTRFWDKMANNRDMLFRTMYVLLGVTGIVIIYFVVKAVR